MLSLSNVGRALCVVFLFALSINVFLNSTVSLFKRSTPFESQLSLSVINTTLSKLIDDKFSTFGALNGSFPTTSNATRQVEAAAEAEVNGTKACEKSDDLLPESLRELHERQHLVNYSAIWMSQLEINVVLLHLNHVRTYLEWGSGGSTLNFARFAQERAYSVEHNPEWCSMMLEALSTSASHELWPARVRYHCVPVERGYKGWGVHSPFEEGSYTQFRAYVDKIDDLNETSFDFILVDGRARIPSAIKALSYISDTSVVVLHDAERVFKNHENYADVWRFYEAIDSVGGKDKQGLLVMRRKSQLRYLQENHSAVQAILDEGYANR